MKDYKTVVDERFDVEEAAGVSIYDADQPIGKYTRSKLFSALNRFLRDYSSKNGDLKDKKLLDVGCGSGGMLDFFHTQGFKPENLTGIDLSEQRILKAKQNYPELQFLHQDAVALDRSEKYDLITSFDMFSHISGEKDLVQALGNLNEVMDEKGLFVWYDIHSKDHYDSPKEADSWGFSTQQMRDLSQKSGFEVVQVVPLFKLFFNRYHSVYQAGRVPHKLLSFLEKVLPGSPGNVMMVLRKKRN